MKKKKKYGKNNVFQNLLKMRVLLKWDCERKDNKKKGKLQDKR